MHTPTHRPPDVPSDVDVRSLADVLRWRAAAQGDRTALTFLADGESVAARLTFRDLDRHARHVAALLQRRGVRGHAVILMFQPGPEFLVGFLACLYAGAMGVPLYPPDMKRLARTLPRFLAIVEDCEADVILTTAQMKAVGSAALEYAPRLASREWLAVDEGGASLQGDWVDPGVALDDVAFLQYTSGSTGDPKGVIVSHRALLLNYDLLTRMFRGVAGETTVTWLPNYHDMGLIDGWTRPIFLGCHNVAMPPIAFLKNPPCWLKAVSTYRAGISGAPNFAYELCLARVTDEDVAALDLSCWHTAYSGAEPVRAATLRRFSQRFRPAGFRPEAFSPGYGLAEATLAVSCSDPLDLPLILSVRKGALEANRVELTSEDDPEGQLAVGVGRPVVDLAIVEPETREVLPPARVGEIWAKGPTMADGYWHRPEVTAEVFAAHVQGDPVTPWLRTGDLGFQVEGGEIFICGRRKDLVIIRGRNLYPQDVEKTVEEADPATLRPGCNAVFAVDVDGEERLVVVQEVQRRSKDEASEWKNRRLSDAQVEAFAPRLDEPPVFEATLRAMRAVVSENHGVDPYAIVLIKAGSIPKTSSGKIQRRSCKAAFLSDALEVVKTWRANGAAGSATAKEPATARPMAPTQAGPAAPSSALHAWLRDTLAARLHLTAAEVDEHRPFAQLGLDSREGLILVGDLEKRLGRRLSASLLYDYPTLDRLVRHLEEGASALATLTGAPSVATEEPIAIVGLGCRFPGADGPDAFWALLRGGIDAVRDLPDDRWDPEALVDADPGAPGKMCSRAGGFLDGMDQFDPRAFDITPREAARMDPQQRLLLEVTAEALEHAGLPPATVAGRRAGVFVGISSFDYGRHLFQDRAGIDAYYGTGAALSIAANRISYHFDLHGPSLAVDSACSSSLVAVHLAMAALRRGECDLAIAGGVNALLLPDVNIAFTKAGVLSPDGRCRTFDAAANGITRAEGAGVVVLKPLSRAVAERDHVWAVLRGSAVVSDGRSNGLMAPNGLAQQATLAAAYRDAGVAPVDVQYVEAHGTGTHLGDPIEVNALAAVLGQGRPVDRPLRVGSVKTNFGHLEAGAGIAGLIKTTLSLKHRELVPTVHFQRANPHIPFESLNVRVQDRVEPWPAPPGSAVAGVSAFGFGGTNAHVVVTEAPPTPEEAVPADGPTLLLLSARSPAGVTRLAGRVAGMARTAPTGLSLEQLAATAALRRAHLPHRLAVVAGSLTDAAERLAAIAEGKPERSTTLGEVLPEASRGVVFVFPGQGGQWHAMGRDLLATEPYFRRALERYDAVFVPMAGWSLLEELGRDEETSRVDDITYTQPLLFAVQAALAETWASLGVHPAALVGHSMGEVTAAYVAGRLELPEALRLILHRGRIMSRARGRGTMVAVELDYDAASRLAADFPGQLSVAANNAPTSSTLAGDPSAVAEVIRRLKERDVFCRELRVEVAGHSPHMEDLKAELRDAAGEIPTRATRAPLYSTLLASRADDEPLDGDYWARNMREPVRFREAVERLLEAGARVFLELSPHPVLQNALHQNAAAAGLEVVTVASLRRNADDREALLAAAGALHVHGVPVALDRLYPRPLRTAPLPATPWEHQRCWLEPVSPPTATIRQGGEHPLLAHHTESPSRPGEHAFELDADVTSLAWVNDHRVQGHPVFPATGYLELVRACCHEAFGRWDVPLSAVQFHRALILGARSRRLHTHLSPVDAQKAHFEVFSRSLDEADGPWTRHASGDVLLEPGTARPLVPFDPAVVRARCTEVLAAGDHYAGFQARAIDYTGPFRAVREVLRTEGEALGSVLLPDESSSFHVHPALLDACLQVMGATLPDGDDTARTYMPVGLERLAILRSPGRLVSSHVVRRPSDRPDRHVADILLSDEVGEPWGLALGLQVQAVDRAEVVRAGVSEWIFEVAWDETPLSPDAPASAGGTWLLLTDATGLGQRLAARLEADGRRVVTRSWRELALPEHVDRLLDACDAPECPLRRVLFLGALDAPGADATADVLLGFHVEATGTIVGLAQALARRASPPARALWLVTRQAEAVPGDAVGPDVGQAGVWGLGRSLGHEHAELWGGLVDLDAETPEAVLVDEVARAGLEDQVARRGARRLCPRLVRRATPTATNGLICDPDGTYLVTGGLGALGLELAAWLAARGARHLVLTSRSGVAPRAEWPGLAALGDRRAAALLALEQKGVCVTTAAVDAADEAGMARVMLAPDRPPLRGLIHAAGVVVPKPVLAVSRDDLRAEALSKVAGAWTLHRLTRDRELDFFVTFSSASAVWGSRLLAGYGAANHVLDALVHRRRHEGRAGLSVNWARWGDAGMAVDAEQTRFLERTGLRPMPPALALAALDDLLAVGATQATVGDVDWSVFKTAYEVEPRRRLLSRLVVRKPAPGAAATAPTADAAGGLRARLAALPDAASRRDAIREIVLGQVAEVLGLAVDALQPDRSLLAQGLDSLAAGDLRGRLQKTLSITLNVLSLLKGDSARQVADALSAQVEAALAPAAPATDASTTRRGPDAEVLPIEIRAHESLEVQPEREASPREILLTGATGFLGLHVLDQLLRQTDATVHCLVKADDDATARARLLARLDEAGLPHADRQDRIVAVAGDLSRPTLGLSPGRWRLLAECIDAIHHVGYVVNFLFSYEDLRPANVLSYIDLLRLASTHHRKPVHFVSSFSVLLTSEYAGRTIRADDPLFHGDGGYREGKRACEALTAEARRRGLPIAIYRPPFIGWNSRSGFANDRDFLIRLLRGCLALGAAPDLDVLFYIAPVDYVADALVRLSRVPSAPNGTYNLLTTPTGTPWVDLVELARRAGAAIATEPFAIWRQRLDRAGPSNPLHVFFPLMDPSVQESGSAVMDLFHRRSAPGHIDLSATFERLGPPDPSALVDERLVRTFLAREGGST
jgi:thioester reductase-like protein